MILTRTWESNTQRAARRPCRRRLLAATDKTKQVSGTADRKANTKNWSLPDSETDSQTRVSDSVNQIATFYYSQLFISYFCVASRNPSPDSEYTSPSSADINEALHLYLVWLAQWINPPPPLDVCIPPPLRKSTSEDWRAILRHPSWCCIHFLSKTFIFTQISPDYKD